MSKKNLDQEFKKLVEDHEQEIHDKLAQAEKFLDEAEKLSEKYGIPFYSSVSPLSQNYVPASFEKKFQEKVSEEILEELELCGYLEYGGSGWEHSAVC